MTVGALFILDTPSSLVEGGMLVEARQSLIKIRGNKSNVDDELAELVSSSELAKDDHEPLKTIFERFFLPETRGIPLEKMDEVWKKHWYWHRFVGGQL
ncbi:hypothetical protein OIU77_025488 [Salix suchowensis]|uniref:Uncharacterized protein n=1 Tax=Salix suchowensis TaxID=1278906 RepID=A0ABQ9BZE7_9ROSI|nr:hypothetical protein OIU77_025488 [Salix suchowensis]